MAPDVLYERDRELGGIAEALDHARSGEGVTVVLEGAAGIGKSAVLERATTLAAEHGLKVLRARGAEMETDFAFGGIRQLVEGPLHRASAEARAELLQGPAGAAAGLLGLPGLAPDADDQAGVSPDTSFLVLHGLYWLVANLAAVQPVALVVDDAHWLDTATLRFLAFLQSRLDGLPVVLILAARPERSAAADPLLAAIATDSAARVLRPAPLSIAALESLIRAELPGAPAPAFVGACHRATGGVPFLARQLVAALADGGVSPTAQSAARVEATGAQTVRRWVLLRLGRLPAPAAALARAVAVLESAELRHAAALADIDVAVAGTEADRLERAGLLAPGRPLRFTHPIVRAGVYADLARAARSAAHRQAAGLLAADPGNEERVAEHLLFTDPAADPWVVARLRAAATQAADRGAPEVAAALLDRVVAEPPTPAERGPVLLELGTAAVLAGRPDGGDLLAAARDAVHGDPPTRLRASLLLAQVLSRAERPTDAIRVLDAAAAQLGGDLEAAERLELLAVSVGMLNVDTAPGMRKRIDVARAAAEYPDASRGILGIGAMWAAQTNEPATVAERLALRCLAGGASPAQDPADLPWFPQATVALLWADAPAAALSALDEGVRSGLAAGDAGLISVSLAHRSWARLRAGDLGRAAADAAAVLDTPGLSAPWLFQAIAATVLMNANVQQGELAAAERVLERYPAPSPPANQTRATQLLARGRLRVAQRRLPEALADMLAAGAAATAIGIVSPGHLAWRSGAALVARGLGDDAAAHGYAQEEVTLAQVHGGGRTIAVALRALGVVTGGPEGEAHLRDALTLLGGDGMALERAHTQYALGARLRRENQRRQARGLLHDARDVALRVGAAPLAQAAAAELEATGARPRSVELFGAASLTVSERRVAELAAQGLTNREIAQQLFVTARTVEGHLTRTFQKLDIEVRQELAEALAAE